MSQETPLTEKQQYWLTHIQACEQSGLTMKAYAEGNSLNIGAFYAWKKTLRRKGAIDPPEPETKGLFHKATVSDDRTARAQLRFPSGLVLEFDTGTAPLWIAGLLRALP